MPRTKKVTKNKGTVAETKKSLTAKTEKFKETVMKKAISAKKNTEKATTVNIVLQYGDKNITYDDLIQNAKNKFQYDMGGNADSVKEISLYVKPEENKVYFVMDNAIEGAYDL